MSEFRDSSLDRHAFDLAVLMAEHPPRLHNPNKRVVLDIACPPGAISRGTIGYTRWAAMDLPEHLEPAPADLVVPRPGFFDYGRALDGDDVVEWHLNFADPDVFAYYGGGLFAQDEMQVAEHPALGALREALVAAGVDARTDGPDGPTPVLVTGVERRVVVATNPNAGAGRPHGLYGNAFAAATPDAIRRATIPIVPPTVTNVVAIAALQRLGDPPDARHRLHGLPRRRPGVRAAGRQSRPGRRPHRLLGLWRVRRQPRPHGAAPGRGGPHGWARAPRVPHRLDHRWRAARRCAAAPRRACPRGAHQDRGPAGGHRRAGLPLGRQRRQLSGPHREGERRPLPPACWAPAASPRTTARTRPSPPSSTTRWRTWRPRSASAPAEEDPSSRPGP
jgi:hypothetical protein